MKNIFSPYLSYNAKFNFVLCHLYCFYPLVQISSFFFRTLEFIAVIPLSSTSDYAIFIPFLPSLFYFCFLSITFTFFIRLKVNHDGYSYPAGVAICYLTDYLFRFIILDVVSNDNAVAIFKKTIKWVCIVMKVIILGGIWLTVPPILIGTYTLVNITYDSIFFMKYLESATIALNFAISMKLM